MNGKQTLFWGLAPGCGGHFCQLRFWLVSGAKVALVTAHAGDAGLRGGVWLQRWCVAAVSRRTLGTRFVSSLPTAVLRAFQMELESQPVAEVMTTR